MKFFSFLFLCFRFSAWSVSFDWSGWTRVEAYYQNSEEHNYYANYHFVLQPEIHVIDGLSITSRLDLNPLTGNPFAPSRIYRQTGPVLIYSANSNQKELEWGSLFLKISQIYMDYENEFLKVRLGRAPYNFGMGATYSASKDPFLHWISVYNQAAVYLEYSQFYLQPVLLHQEEDFVSETIRDENQGETTSYRKKDSLFGLAQAGFINEDWRVEAFYQHDFKDSSFVEVFGQYEQTNWDIKSSVSYAFEEGTNMALALEAAIDIPYSFPFKFEIKSGGAFGELSFHPNYDVALLFWNRFMSGRENSSLQIAESQITDGVYLSPRLLFSFLNETLKIRPLGLLARALKEKTFYYELDLEGMYQLDESLFFSLKGGALYSKEMHFALLAQAAVSF